MGVYVTSTERTLCNCYRGNSGLFSFSSAGPEGRFSANKKIHERGSCLGGRLHEFFPVLWIGTQFTTNGSPDGVQPSLQNCFVDSQNKEQQVQTPDQGDELDAVEVLAQQ